MHHDLIIVGGGASGLIAAITAKDFGIDVAIVEGSDRIGKKIVMVDVIYLIIVLNHHSLIIIVPIQIFNFVP